jgi:hypothetical protein
VKKFLIPLATAIAALLSQQSLASDTNNPTQSSPIALTINQRDTIAPFKLMLPEPVSNLMLVNAKSDLMKGGWQATHRSHRSHSSHSSHRSHRSGR